MVRSIAATQTPKVMQRERLEIMDNDLAGYLDNVISTLLSAIAPPPPAMFTAVTAIVDGTATQEQIDYCTNIVHAEFNAHEGCMVDTVRDMSDQDGFPHYFINHVVRTYVRLTDKREAEMAEQYSEKTAERNDPWASVARHP